MKVLYMQFFRLWFFYFLPVGCTVVLRGVTSGAELRIAALSKKFWAHSFL